MGGRATKMCSQSILQGTTGTRAEHRRDAGELTSAYGEIMLKQTHTILVVDDEPSSLLLLERVLRPLYKVITAGSGEVALEVLKTEEISLLITDQRMPGISGTELLRESQLLRP